jgi:hypothetical protein
MLRILNMLMGFKFVFLVFELSSVEVNHYDVVNIEVFAEICGGLMIQLVLNLTIIELKMMLTLKLYHGFKNV